MKRTDKLKQTYLSSFKIFSKLTEFWISSVLFDIFVFLTGRPFISWKENIAEIKSLECVTVTSIFWSKLSHYLVFHILVIIGQRNFQSEKINFPLCFCTAQFEWNRWFIAKIVTKCEDSYHTDSEILRRQSEFERCQCACKRKHFHFPQPTLHRKFSRINI